jgi:hypothetical protein
MSWKTGAFWAGLATAAGMGAHFALTSDQVSAVLSWTDQLTQVLAIAGTALAAFIAGLKSESK